MAIRKRRVFNCPARVGEEASHINSCSLPSVFCADVESIRVNQADILPLPKRLATISRSFSIKTS